MKHCYGRLWILVLFSITASQALAFLPPTNSPLPNIDQRLKPAMQEDALPAEKAAAIAGLRTLVPKLKVDFEPVTGTPKIISATDGFLSDAAGNGKAISAGSLSSFAAGDPYRVTKAFLREHTNLFGYGPEILDQAVIKREFTTAHNGLKTVVWEQQLDGIPLFEAVLISHTTSKEELVNIGSQFIPDAGGAADRGVPNRAALLAAPGVSAAQAIILAAQNVGETADAGMLVAAGEPATDATRSQKFQAPFLPGESEVKLVWLPMDHETLRLCWDVLLTSRQRGEMFRILLDVETGEVLLRRCLTHYISDASYNVFTSDSPSPFSPGFATPVTTQPPLVPRTLVTLPALNTNASPAGWIDDGGNETRGNNVDAHTDRNDDDVADVPRPQGSPFRVFDFSMDLATQAPTNYSQAAVVQLFYLCNWMHDKLYELGFTEAAGNFQGNNFGRGGVGNDAVQADAQDGGGFNNANFSTPSDGFPGRMQMYIFNGPTPDRDGDFDAEVVLHEYTHGLSNRRVGGGVGISALQSDGMGEGWSDFYAIALLSEAGDDVNGNYASGGYASHLLSAGYLQNYYFGIRRYPYITDMTKNPLTFNDIDSAQANNCASSAPYNPIFGSCSAINADEVHNQGELWCVTLWEARANLINKYGWAVGNQLILQLVTDGMNLSPANPNFLQARDAILQADMVDTGGANRNELWAAFAKRGMGVTATSPSSSTTSGVHEAFDVPDDLQITPAVLSVSGPIGGPFTPNPVFFNLSNAGSNTLNWSLVNTSAWITVSPASGTLPASGFTTNVMATVLSAATNFPLGQYTAFIWFTNLTSGVAQSRSIALSVVGRNMFDDFEPGIDMSQWSGFGGVVGSTVLAINYGGSVSPPNSLWFGDGGSRFATTLPINTSEGGTIGFNIRLANGTSSTWEQADALPAEGVTLEYSTNGGAAWFVLGNYDTTAYYVWTAVVLSIPPEAQGTAVQFRWRQKSHSGSGFDHWALDNVTVDAGPSPPSIATQPANLTTVVGGMATFTVIAAGTSPFAYEWRFNDSPLAGSTNASLILSNVQFSQAGLYSVVVTNAHGSATSSNAQLQVMDASSFVAVFDDPLFVDTTSGFVGAESDNVQASLASLGFSVTTFTNIPAATASYRVLLFPEMEIGNLTPSLSSGARMALSNFVAGGGLMIIHGTPGGLYSGPLLNSVFGFAVQEFQVTDGTVFNRGNQAIGTAFTNAPTTLASMNASTILQSNSLPAGARNIYVNGSQSLVAEMYLGNGKIIFLGWDWYNAAPIGTVNGGWLTVLQRAVLELGPLAPVILTQPASQMAPTGSVACVSVTANGAMPLSYQWRKEATNILDATNATFCMTNVTLGDSGNYDVVLTNTIGAVTSLVATVTVYTPTPPVITQDPQSQTAVAGTNLNLNVTATGEVPLIYQWEFNGTNLANATNSVLTLNNIQATNAGDYRVFVTNTLGSATSQVATITVVFAPAITQSPQSQTVVDGTNAIFTVIATGTEPLTYQWRHAGTNLPGMINTNLTLTNIVFADGGLYDVAVSNAYGMVTSAVATLTVVSPPTISQQPQSQSVPAGTNVTFTVIATGSGVLSYQWRFGGVDLLGATGPDLNITNVQSANTGDYTVVITNFVGSITSEVATLTVTPALPLITLQPRSQGVFLGFSVGFNASATGTDPFSYQWQLNESDIAGATNTSLAVTNVQQDTAGLYRLVVSNSLGAVPSDAALLALVPVASWGWNSNGQNNLPVELTNAVQVSAGARHNVALRRDGIVIAWGAADQTNVPPDLTNIISVAAGGGHNLALRMNGIVLAWGGNNSFGQTNVPSNLSNVVALAAGGSHSLALRSNGTVTAWGLNTSGQTSVPFGLSNVVAIAAGSNHSVALKADGKVVAWGSNSSGQTSPASNVTDVVAIAAGSLHTLALKRDGTVVVWGANNFNQTNVPAGLSNVIGIAGGALHSLVLRDDGSLIAWGAGLTNNGVYPNFGQSLIPETVTNCTAISGGSAHSLALAGDGEPFVTEPPISRTGFTGRRVVFRAAATGARPLSYQWRFNGTNIDGATNQLLVLESPPMSSVGNYSVVVSNGPGTAVSSDAFLTLTETSPFVITQPLSQPVYLGGRAQLQVVADGSGPFFYQWRLNGVDIAGATNATLLLERALLNQAGNYSVVVSNDFGVVSSAKAGVSILQVVAWGAGTNFTQVAPNYAQSIVPTGLNNAVSVAGGVYHSLALKSDSKVAAWGAGTNTGSSPHFRQSIVPAGLSNVVAVAGGYHTLALKADGSLVAWGAGTNNTGLQPNYGQSLIPASATGIVAVAAGDYHSVALRNDGRVLAWGYNGFSQTNVPALATNNVVAIASRGNHILARKADGSLVHWGSPATLPIGVSNIVTIAAGVNHSLALKSDGTVASWGSQTIVPAGLSNVVDIAAGFDHSVALRSDGTVVTWGATNLYGRHAIPPGLTNVIGIACGGYNSLAFLGDGSALIKWQPASRSVFLGTAANFNVGAVGAQPLGYKWQLNGTDIEGATNSSLIIGSAQATNAGNYRVVVTNVFGSVTSAVASLTVLVPLGQAVDAPGLIWSTSGNAAWFGESAITHDGVDAAQSGLITDNQQSTVQTTVTGPGTLTFWWKVSSEEFFDFLNFFIDGIQQTGISGDVNWQQQTFNVAAGSHTLRWTYSKDSSVGVGLDAGWLDQVLFATNPPVITLQPLGQTNSVGAVVTLNVTATGAPPLTYQWLKGDTNLNGASSPSFTILNGTRHDSGVYAVVVSNPGGSTSSSNATVLIRVPQRLGTIAVLPDGTVTFTSADLDGGALLPDDLANFEPQVSTDLVNWNALTNSLSLTNGLLLLRDLESTNYPARFYRIIER